MKKCICIFLFAIIFIRINSQIKQNPIYLDSKSNPFVLSTTDNYYYVHTKGKSFKINKESGNIEDTKTNTFTSYKNHLYLIDNSNNNYIYSYNMDIYYLINYNPFISYNTISINPNGISLKNIGGIAQDNEFIIYGYTTNYLVFLSKSQGHSASLKINNIDDKLSCKFIKDEYFVCGMIISENLFLDCFIYHINSGSTSGDTLTKYSNIESLTYNSISSFGLYDTDINDIKLLCRVEVKTINCTFIKITINNDSGFDSLGGNDISFITSASFTEKNCYFSKFNSEYLFCCGIQDYLKCFKINCNDYKKNKEFSLSVSGDNSYLTIKNNNNYITLFFMNTIGSTNKVYEYYIYIPTCENKNYEILNSLNENKSPVEKERLNHLFTVKTNNYYFEIKNRINDFGYFTLNNNKINGRMLISNNDYILDFIVTYNDKSTSFNKTVYYIVSVEEDKAYEKECQITLTFKACYHSCKKCSLDINSSNDLEHNCIECKDKYYKAPEVKSNCFSNEEKKLNWYFDSAISEFGLCHEVCRTCKGPTENDCTSCSITKYLDNNCKLYCSEGYFLTQNGINPDSYFICNECYQNCRTCIEKGNAQNMKCETCKEKQIRYNNSCFDIDDILIKSFYEPENGNMYSTSCYEKFGLYIKEDSNECIPLPNEEEGYYISTNKTGLLSKCHSNCLSCNNGPINDLSGNIQSMECKACKDSNESQKTTIRFKNNCFSILQYEKSKITFDISELDLNNHLGSCKYFGKAIYYNNYECIDKPNNTYYVLSDANENTGVIKNCSDACNSCLGDGISNNTNCIECAQGYFKTEDSDTHCLINDSISLDNYYFNTSDNIYYHCHHNCKGCNGSYNQNTKEMHCLDCIENYYFIYGENNCYNFTFLKDNKYYFNYNDSKFHKCYYTCTECLNFEPNETNHFCINCISGYYFLENTNNCHDMNITEQGYYLDNIYIMEGKQLFRKCYFSCKTCEWGIILNSTTNESNHNCKECADNYYRLDNDTYPNNCYDNETIRALKEKNKIKSFDSDITAKDFKVQIKGDITSYVNSSKVINGSNFLAVVMSSDKMNSEEQLKNGISAVDLGNCTNVIKEYYNISQEENLIILNMETKNDESQKNENNNNDDKSFNLGKNTQLEIYDYSGRKLNLSVCKESIKVMKYIGDAEDQLDMNSAKSLSSQGIDVFNAEDDFFNDICHQYENSDGIDIILTDRKNDIYQDATFCQDGCIYKGINYNLKAANCICDSSNLQEEEGNTTTNIGKESKDNNNDQSLAESFITNLFKFHFDVLRCYNLALNKKILIHNIGFYCLSLMFILQIIFFFVYLIKKLRPLKTFMLIFNNNNMNNYQNNNKINNDKIFNHYTNANPLPKNKNSIKISKIENNKNQENKVKKYIKDKLLKKQINLLDKKRDILNFRRVAGSENDSNKTIIITNNFAPTININKPINNIKSKSKKLANLRRENNKIISNIKYNKKQIIKRNILAKNEKNKNKVKNISKMETTQGKNNNYYIKSKVNNVNTIKLTKTDFDIQNLDYEEAIIYDKRSYLRMYWGFLVDSQIILGTFFTDNNLDLFVIKLSFLVCTFQISFFLNALFYTDEYISNAYHNDGVLDFFSGLPKSIYSFFATLITTNLLRMLSSSKNELMRVIKRNGRFQNYINIINIKLAKLRKKLIAYFVLVFLLESFFLYYVTVFCAVYRYSQKYWFIGCLESFGMDSLVAIITCIFLSLFRYIGIKAHIKCFYIFANIISSFL